MHPPTLDTIRQAVTQLPSSDASHLLAGWIGEVLEHTTLIQAWDSGPDSRYGGSADSYEFLHYLAGYVRTRADQASPTSATTPLLSQQDFSALCGFIQSEDGCGFTIADELSAVSDEAWMFWERGAFDELEYWERDAIQKTLDHRDFPRPPCAPACRPLSNGR